MKRYAFLIVAAAVAVIFTALSPAGASSAADHTAAISGCRFNYGFVWHNANPNYLGLTRTNVHSIVSVGGVNCSRAQDRAIMVCTYLGARGAHINVTYYGRIVHLGVSQTNCRRFAIGSGITRATLLSGRAGGLQYRNSPSLGWSTHFVVG